MPCNSNLCKYEYIFYEIIFLIALITLTGDGVRRDAINISKPVYTFRCVNVKSKLK